MCVMSFSSAFITAAGTFVLKNLATDHVIKILCNKWIRKSSELSSLSMVLLPYGLCFDPLVLSHGITSILRLSGLDVATLIIGNTIML